MANTIQMKRGPAGNWTSTDPTLAAGEFGFETDTGKFKCGDGSTAWSALGYFEPGDPPPAPVVWTFQGSATGYSSKWNRESFSLVSDGNAVQIANYGTSSTAAGVAYGGGVMSSEYAFITGLSPNSRIIEKFPFAADSETATNVGTLSQSYAYMANNNTATHGYTAGHTPVTTNIDKFSTVSDGDGAVAAYLTVGRYALSGQNSDSHGYHAGGVDSNVIDKFPFASDGNSVDVGNLSAPRYQSHGMSSTENGYAAGGQIFPQYAPNSGRIDKFSFASDGNATYIGNLTTYKEYDGASVSSTTHGYSAGGFYTQPTFASSNIIEKFSFTSDGNSVDVGDVVNSGYDTAGFQI